MNLKELIEDSFPAMERMLDEAHRNDFYARPNDALEEYNWGFGTLIRLKILGRRRKLLQAFQELGYEDRDQMTLLMIRLFHQHITLDCGDAPLPESEQEPDHEDTHDDGGGIGCQ